MIAGTHGFRTQTWLECIDDISTGLLRSLTAATPLIISHDPRYENL